MDQIDNAVEAQQPGAIRIFCCGGAGVGIGKYFELERDKITPGYASLSPVYMDTSKASTYEVPEKFFYHLPEKDGSGGVRGENGADIMKYTGEMLQKFPPFDHNIVISSTTGGSGSVMAPSIVSELMAQGKSVIVFAVGGDDTLQYVKNTVTTMLSYENIAKTRSKPVVMQYLQNGVDGSIEDVDLKIHLAISCLTVLYSRQNKNLDSQDLHNWLHFDKVTSFQPQIGVLSIHQKELKLTDEGLISVVTLNKDLNGTRVGQPVEYQRVGVPMNLDANQKELMFPLHFAVTDGFIDSVMKNLRRQVREYDSKATARVVRNQLSTGDEKVAGNGLVFE